MATVTYADDLVAAQPGESGGIWSWLTTVDHKRIGILYGASAVVFFIIGGLEALIIRLQLATPDGQIVNPDTYNQLFTMHGTTMVFLFVMPIAAAFGNYFMPIMIGARDVAFPRLNALSYWIFLAGGIYISSSFFLGGFPDGAWVGYSPLATQGEILRMDFWAIGLLILGTASLLGAINFITTIFTMRAPGMTLFRMPVFVWMQLVVAFLLAFSLPLVTIGLFQVLFDRNFGTLFYDAAGGGDPVLWQHMFWLFGHPEVYILILPAMGIVSEVLPTFSRKPLFGYQFVVFAGAAIGFLGFGVWAHHMFTAGLGPVAEIAFGLATMTIAVPTGIKIFNWVGTMWGGDIRLTTPMLFAIGFVAMFTIGGLSGVTHSIVPADTQQHDSYYVVAHFHYVLFGGAVFGIFSGIYYWFPKVFGKLLNERLGKVHFWTMLLGFNLTFAPMHLLGLNGMPRRIAAYGDGLGWNAWNMVATIGSFLIALSILIWLINTVRTVRSGEEAGPDPWDGRTLEWTTSSPPIEHNFDVIPAVEAVDDFWHKKYGEDEDGLPVRLDTNPLDSSAVPGSEKVSVHLPSPSYYPLLLAIGLVTLFYGFLWPPVGFIFMALGLATMLWAIYGWALEDIDHPVGDGHSDHHGGDDHDDGAHEEEAEIVGEEA
jgi:cytochrome c oxidase subunit 1